MRRASLVILVLAVIAAAVVLLMRVDAPAERGDGLSIEPDAPAPADAESQLAAVAEEGTASTAAVHAPGTARATAAEAKVATARVIVRVVSSDDGQPVPRATVSVWPKTPDVERNRGRASAERTGSPTDANGMLVVDLVAGRAHEIRAYAPGGGRRRDDAEIGPLAAGERAELVMRVPTKPDLVFHGRVVDERDLPIEGARVSMLTEHDPTQRALALPVDGPLAARSDADGAFVVERMSWSPATLLVDADGYSIVAVSPGAGHETRELAAEIPLMRAGTIAFQASGARGAALAGATVTLRCESRDATLEAGDPPPDARPGPLPALHWTATLDGQGSCTFAGVPARHRIGLSLSEGVFERRHDPDVGALEPGETRAIAWRIGGGCRVTGQIVDAEGTPLPGQELWLVPDPGDGSPTIDDSRRESLVGRAVSDARGKFALDDVAAGAWMLGPRYAWEPRDAPYPLATRFAVAGDVEALHVVVRLPRSVYVTGRVEDPDGRPFRGAGIALAGYPRAEGYSFHDGTFRAGPLPSGGFTWVQASCFSCAFAPSEAVAVELVDEPPPVVLRLRRGGTIEGRVVDAQSGEALEARVLAELLHPAGGRTQFDARQTLERPSFAVERLPAGEYVVRALAASGGVAELRGVRLEAGGVVRELELRVPRATATVRLDATDAAGECDAEVLVDGVVWKACALASGETCDVRVPHGRVVVRVSLAEAETDPAEQEVALESGETRTVVLARIVR